MGFKLEFKGLIGNHNNSKYLEVVFNFWDITVHHILDPPSAAVMEELSYNSIHLWATTGL